jgi:hypothetical protein
MRGAAIVTDSKMKDEALLLNPEVTFCLSWENVGAALN